MPDLPSTVQAGPFTYTLSVGGDAWVRAQLKDLDPDLVGFTSNNELEISVKPEMAPDAEREVVFHELLHAVVNAGATRIRDLGAHPTEEDVVGALSPVLLAALRDNGALVDYLLGED